MLGGVDVTCLHERAGYVEEGFGPVGLSGCDMLVA